MTGVSFFFLQQWMHEDEVHRQCKASMDVLDRLPPIVRDAVHESPHYTDTRAAKRLVRLYGAEAAARIILLRGDGEG